MKAKIGLALSGGGARGIAHIGVLAALEKYGIHPEIISGTSIGALVGVLYASGYEPASILALIKASKLHKVISWAFPSGGLLDLDKIEKLLRSHIPEDDFSALKKRFYCAVTNLNTGKSELISSGKLIDYVLASASIPIVFEPRIINGQSYVDGGILNNLPIEPLLDQANVIIGVHVNHNEELKEISGIKAIAERSFRLAISKDVDDKFDRCNLVIDPSAMQQYSVFDFSKADEIYAIGFSETENLILQYSNLIDLEQVIAEKKRRQQEK